MKYLILFIFLTFYFPSIAKTTYLKIQTSEGVRSSYLAHLTSLEEKLFEDTDGEMEISLFSKNAIVPVSATSKAISKEALDGDLTQVNLLLLHVHPAFGLIEDLMAEKRSPKEVTDFCMKEGGRRILQDIHDQVHDNVYVVGCGSFYRDSFISTSFLQGKESLKDLTVYAREGISKELFRLYGAKPVRKRYKYNVNVLNDLRAGLDIAPESKMIPGYENFLPESQRSYIFDDYYLMPLYQFSISKKIWESLSDKAKKGLTTWFKEAFYDLADNVSNPITPAREMDINKSLFRNFVLDTWTSFLEGNISYKDMELVMKTYKQYALLESKTPSSLFDESSF